jgi:hypothetical protein
MKKLILLAMLFLSTKAVLAQDEEGERKGFQKEKLFIGGNFGLMFGNTTLINISPQVGYRFSQLFAAGIGINGQYSSQRVFTMSGQEGRQKLGIVGLNVFGRIYPLDQLMLQVQPEANYLFGNVKFPGLNPETTKIDASIVPSLLVGGGLVLPAGRGAFIASVFVDILQHEKTPYGTRPIYNFGYNISL